MKKIILSTVLLFALVTPVLAFSWTGNIEADVAVSGPFETLDIEHSDTVTFLFHAPINAEVPMSISGEGYYEFSSSTKLDGSEDLLLAHLIDLSSLKYNVQIPYGDSAFFLVDAGRFGTSDITGLILDQPVDGARLLFENQGVQLSSLIGFTGLLNAHSITMNIAPNETILSDAYTLAAPFVLANLSLQLPQLFANQNVYGEVFSAIDVGSKENPDNRMYATAALNGPISDNIYYTVSSTMGLSQGKEKWAISNISSLEVSSFFSFASSLLSWKTIFATGGAENTFTTFTSNAANISQTLEYAGHVKTGLVGTMRPVNNLLVFFEPNVLFNVMNESAEKGYTGLQWLCAMKWDIFADLTLVTSAGQFLPASTEEESYFEANVKLALTF